MSNPAESYERDMVPVIFGPLATRLVARARPAGGERVADLACGTGIVARRVAPLVGAGGRVVGLDLSPGMLDVARVAADRERVAIEWHEGSVEALPFADASFDLVLCQQGLMFFPNRPTAVAEMYRVLVPGGRVALTVTQGLEQHPFEQQLDAAFLRQTGASVMGLLYSMGNVDELRGLLSAAGFIEIETVPVTIDASFATPDRYLEMRIAVLAAAVPQFQHINAADREALVTAIRDDLEAPLRELTVGDQVVNPVHFHIARAYRP